MIGSISGFKAVFCEGVSLGDFATVASCFDELTADFGELGLVLSVHDGEVFVLGKC